MWVICVAPSPPGASGEWREQGVDYAVRVVQRQTVQEHVRGAVLPRVTQVTHMAAQVAVAQHNAWKQRNRVTNMELVIAASIKCRSVWYKKNYLLLFIKESKETKEEGKQNRVNMESSEAGTIWSPKRLTNISGLFITCIKCKIYREQLRIK